MAARWNSSRAPKASQAHPLEAVMGLQVREAHLDALSFIARLVEGLGSHEPARHIPGVFVKIAGDFPHSRPPTCAEVGSPGVDLNHRPDG